MASACTVDIQNKKCRDALHLYYCVDNFRTYSNTKIAATLDIICSEACIQEVNQFYHKESDPKNETDRICLKHNNRYCDAITLVQDHLCVASNDERDECTNGTSHCLDFFVNDLSCCLIQWENRGFVISSIHTGTIDVCGNYYNNCNSTHIGDNHNSTCVGDNCNSTCVNANCNSTCVGANCNSACVSANCNSTCVGDNCNSACNGVNCYSTCVGKSCNSTCNGANCINTCVGGNCSYTEISPRPTIPVPSPIPFSEPTEVTVLVVVAIVAVVLPMIVMPVLVFIRNISKKHLPATN